MAWLEISGEIASDLAESCSEAFEHQGAVSVSFLDAGNVPLLEPLPGTIPLWDKVKIVALFPEDVDISSVHEALSALFPAIALSTTPLAEQEWTRTWLSHFQPMQFGQKLWIIPSEYTPTASSCIEFEASKDIITVNLDPGLAFGTGTHATTALCLTWLDNHPPLQQTVLDYGCGSGILGIAAQKLGARKVWAVDYDPQALLATRDNAARNQIDPMQLTALSPSMLPADMVAETILANILAEPLISLAPILSQHCAPNGKIVLSGMLNNQIESVKAAYSPWFTFAQPRQQAEWVLLVGEKIS